MLECRERPTPLTFHQNPPVVGNCYGFGVPLEKLDEAYIPIGLKYFTLAEMSYCVCSGSIKVSIGIALVRTICVQRRYRYAVWLTIALSTASFLGVFIWFLVSCRPIAASWDRTAGLCRYDGYLPLVYFTFSVAVATDAAFATIPVLALRRLRMARRTKYPLMAVFSLGSLAAVASVGRFPLVPNMSQRFRKEFLCEWHQYLLCGPRSELGEESNSRG